MSAPVTSIERKGLAFSTAAVLLTWKGNIRLVGRSAMKMFSATACQQIAGSQQCRQATRCLPQQIVANSMTKRIVDRLETVEIEAADGKSAASIEEEVVVVGKSCQITIHFPAETLPIVKMHRLEGTGRLALGGAR